MSDENKTITGKCLCGAVQISAAPQKLSVGACHCAMCRKWTGGMLMTIPLGQEVELQGEENITVYESSAWAERGFCKTCGSSLFYRLKRNQSYHVPAALFDELTELPFTHEVFIDEKPSYYALDSDCKKMTGAEVFAMFAPPSSSQA